MSLFEQMGRATDTQRGQRENVKPLFVEYYTDPLCSWCWAFEPQWRRFRYKYADQVCWHYRMGGLLADWRSYDDPFNDVHRPAQMGPQWLQVSELSGVPLDARLYPDSIVFTADMRT